MKNETYTAFIGPTRVAQGREAELAAALAALNQGPHPEGLLVFSDASGQQVDLNLSGRAAQDRPPKGFRPGGARRPGRPKLGVKAREITLLPRHWDWLASQRGGASAALRRLVETAMRAPPPAPTRGRDAAYPFLTAIAGDRPGYEAAIRALFADDREGFAAAMRGWPEDIFAHAWALAGF